MCLRYWGTLIGLPNKDPIPVAGVYRLGPPRSGHLISMAPAPRAPAPQTYLSHTPPSASSTRPVKRNTVHWDKCDLDFCSTKENAAPEPYHPSDFSTQISGSLRTSAPSHEAPFDFGDYKLRGQYRRTPLAAETFIAPEILNRAVNTGTTTDTHQGNAYRRFSAGNSGLEADHCILA